MASNSNKRRRERKRRDEDGDPEFQVAPMVDVLLVLMLFFMSITSTELLKKEKNLQLAEAKDAQPDKNKVKTHELVINVSWNNSDNTAGFTMDGVRYPSADSMKNVLAGHLAQDPKDYVLIRADKDVEYSNISDVMNACASAGIATVSFAVIIGGGKTQAPASSGSSASQ